MESKKLIACFEYIYKRVSENPRMLEAELYEVIINSNFFAELGYETFGKDIRAQRVIPETGKQADYVCLDEYKNVILVLEAKSPSHKTLTDALSQLWDRYVLPLKSQYGVLTNGWKLIVYRRIGNNSNRILTINFDRLIQEKCDNLFRLLKKPIYDFTIYSNVEEYFSNIEKLSLQNELSKELFYETFKFGDDSIFTSMVTSLVELFSFIYPDSKFLKGAYGYWQKTLARKPKKIPDSWKPFLNDDDDIFPFMFCLETAHALLAKLIVAKTCEDLEFVGINVSRFTLAKIHNFRGNIPIVAYPIVLISIIKEMKNQLVYSIFEDDIFDWWKDGFIVLSGKSSGDIFKERIDKPLEDFSESIAKLIFMIYKFDFSDVAGDPLGDLYQQYFDRDTRKALGEFYTPTEVVNYILDTVEYIKIGDKNLLDPACGSGTFIVEALKRYLIESKDEAEKLGWAYIIRELCNSPKIVGFDIHPFACLISRIRFMIELIPYFQKAVQEETPSLFYIRRLPIFRTDSLAIEITPPEFLIETKLFMTEENLVFPIELPIKINDESSLNVNIILPSWRKVVSHDILLYNLNEYFRTLQAMFDAIKTQINQVGESVSIIDLNIQIKDYIRDREDEVYTEISNFFKPYADNILSEINRIQSEFEDGRLIKSIEDAILASILKNYFRYDFVVGNPPFVNIKRFSDEQKLKYKNTYPVVAKGQYDLFTLFFKRGIDLLNDGGKLGFIVGHQLIYERNYMPIRKYILETCQIKTITDIGELYFRETNLPKVILHLRKVDDEAERLKNSIKKIINVESLIEEKWEEDNVTQFRYSEDSKKRFNIYVTDRIYSLLGKIDKNTKKLGEICDRKDKGRGVELGKKGIIAQCIYCKEYFPYSESRTICPHCKESLNEEVKPFSIINDKPAENSVSLIIGENVNKYRVDKVKYIKLGYEGINYKSPELYKGEKILIRKTGIPLISAIENEPHYALQVVYIRKIRDMQFSSNYVVGILNSNLMKFYFLLKFCEIGKKIFPHVRQEDLDEIPIKSQEDEISKKRSHEISQITERILLNVNLQRQLEDFPRAYITEYRMAGIEFNEVQYNFKSGHKLLKPFLIKSLDNGFEFFPDKKEDAIFAETKEKAQYLILLFKDKKVMENDIIKFIIPRENSIVIEVLNKVQKTIDDIQSNPIDQLEDEINRIVYKLYNIDEDEISFIEHFLETRI